MIIKIADFKEYGYCIKGLRKFFKRHDISWPVVRDKGVSTDRLKETGDHMAIAIAEWMEHGKQGETYKDQVSGQQ